MAKTELACLCMEPFNYNIWNSFSNYVFLQLTYKSWFEVGRSIVYINKTKPDIFVIFYGIISHLY